MAKGFVYLLVTQVGTIHQSFTDETASVVQDAWDAMKATRTTEVDGETIVVRGGKLWNDAKIKGGIVCGPIDGVSAPDDFFGDMTPISSTTSQFTSVPLACTNTDEESDLLIITVPANSLDDAQAIIVRANFVFTNEDEVLEPTCELKLFFSEGVFEVMHTQAMDPGPHTERLSYFFEMVRHGNWLIIDHHSIAGVANRLEIEDLDFTEDVVIYVKGTWDIADPAITAECTAAKSFKQPET